MNPTQFIKNCFYVDKIFTKKNALIITGIVAEISLIALLLLSQASILLVSATLFATNLIKLKLFVTNIKKKDDDLNLLLKKKQERERDVEVLNKEIEELKKKLLS